MGGSGSGRQCGKNTTDDMHRLDVRKLAREGHLRPGKRLSWQWSSRGNVQAQIDMQVQGDTVRLIYKTRSNGGEWQDMKYPVCLLYTPCTYGGRRVWWQCPADGCGRRVAVLFGGVMFACRHCHKLAYASQREPDGDEHYTRAGKIRTRLGWVPGIANLPGGKPKGMHWTTYQRLVGKHDAHASRADAHIGKWLTKLGV